ncbi:TRAPP subunit trs31 [Puttea exsequens]|nr:TRAPP subunit trs31 [Puttea exsequens]
MTSPAPSQLPSKPPTTLQQQTSASRAPAQPPPQHAGLRLPSNRKTIYDRNLNRTRTAELSRASFAYLFAEMVSYAQKQVTGIQDLERRLNELGYPLGLRLLPLLLHRSSTPTHPSPRPTRILPLLQLIASPLWKHLFAKPADSIESSSTDPSEYMIIDNEPLVNTYISVPKEMSQLNCAAFVAGIVEGVCAGGGMKAAVSAHNAGEEGAMWPGKTVILVRFEESVVKRENQK